MARQVPDDNWLQTYLRWAGRNESPELFHFWVGATIISTVLERKVICPILFDLHPNMFTVLVAGSQKCRKSTAIAFGVDLLEQMENPPFVMSQKMTPEAMISGFAERAKEIHARTGEPRATGLIVADELSTYLDKHAVQSGMIPILLKFHDCTHPFEYRTKARGLEELPRPYVCLLAGTAPEYLRTSLPIEEAGGGMLARTMLVYQENPGKPQPFLHLDKSFDNLETALVKDLDKIAELEGDITLSEDAHNWYDSWYKDEWYNGKGQPISKDPALRHYYNKKPDHLSTLAIIISVAESDNLEIDTHHFEKAKGILKSTEKLMHKAVGELVKQGMGEVIKTVKDAIIFLDSRKQKPTLRNIMRMTQNIADVQEVKDALETLKTSGSISTKTVDNEICYVPENIHNNMFEESEEDD